MTAAAVAPTTRRELAVDGAAIAVVSAALCVYSTSLPVMTALVPAVWALRLAAFARVRAPSRHGLGAELVFCALVTALGAFNDWSSVDRHGVYAYAVPTDLPGLSSLPLWMLLYWGLILRFMATLATFGGLGPDPSPRDAVRLARRVVHHPWLKIGLELALVIGTRQAIYRTYLDPVASWAPFAAALAAHAWLFPWDARDRRLVLLALTVGPLVEILYIQVGGLHRYHLGWLGGVPLWIALWWALALLLWRDLAPRLLRVLGRLARGSRPPPKTDPMNPTDPGRPPRPHLSRVVDVERAGVEPEARPRSSSRLDDRAQATSGWS